MLKRGRKTGMTLSLEALERRQLMAAHVVGDATVYATIQAAVNAALPGGVINVDAGSYTEQVYVGKSLTIRGAEAGVDARSNPRNAGALAESTVTGILNSKGLRTSSFYLDADNITLDGFVVQGNTSQGDTGAGIVIAPNRSGTHIVNNIVQNNVAGLFIANSSSTNPAIIRFNLFRTNNNAGEDGGRGIYTNGGISGNGITNVLIDSNVFLGNRGSTGTTGLEAAVAFEAIATGKQSNITISNNVFDGNGKAALFFNTVGVTISNNFITNSFDQYSGALRFEGNVQNASITGNTAYNNTGPVVAVDSKGVPGDNSGFIVNGNNFYNNSLAYGTKISVIFDGSVYVGAPDVRNNWWGSSSGPGGDGPGTGDKVYGIGHVVAGGQWSFTKGGKELYSPWSTTRNGTNYAPYYGIAVDGAPIQIEDFDHGGEGVAYHDADTANSGGSTYRKREGVDLQTTSDSGGGLNLAYTKAGEWLSYSINLLLGGTFNLDVRVAGSSTSSTFHFEVDGVNVTGAISTLNTGGTQTWKTITKTGINLSAGQHVVRLVLDTAPSGSLGNFNWFKLSNVAPALIPPTAPGNLVASAVDQTHVSLAWQDNSSNETGFIIERQIGAGAWQQITTTAAGATTFIDATASASTAYSYRVRALGVGGQSAPTNAAPVTTPAAPSVIYLSDLPWASMTNGWGPVEKDMGNGGDSAGDGPAITLNGVVYPKGLGGNAASQVVYNLTGGNYARFVSDVGVDDRQTVNGSIVFQVFLDGVKVFDSGLMGAQSPTQSINIDVTGKSELKLVITDGGDGNAYDHGDWAGARLLVIQAPPAVIEVPSAPASLTATPASYSQVNLSWADVIGETGFKIERSIDGINFTQIATTAAGVVTFNDLTASASTAYTYRVRATNSAGDSDYSPLAGATTPAMPPAATVPGNLAASAVSYQRIDLTWSDSDNENGYKIERSLDGVSFSQIGTAAAGATAYSDLTAAGSTHYYYRVRATGVGGDSDFSATADATTPVAPAVPDAPTNLVATPISAGRIDLAWSDVATETGYKIERSLDGVNFTQIGTAGANQTTYSDTTVSSATKYYYRVRAGNGVGDSGYSLVSNATTPGVAPAAPTGLTALAGSSTQIVLGWTDNSNNEDGLRIERSTDNINFTQLITVGAGVTAYTDQAVSAGQTYYYRVLAYNGVGPSGYSNVASSMVSSAPALPSPMVNGDVGSVGVAGSATYSGGTYTVNGAGADIYGTADAFNFVYQTMTGDGTIIARVSSLQNTDANAKAGIMFRDSLAANAKEASVMVTPANGIKFLTRGSTGGSTASATVASLKAPYWLKLVRSGSTFTSYRSTDGATWTLVGSQTISMGSTIYVGLAVTAHKTTTTAAATFTNVSIV